MTDITPCLEHGYASSQCANLLRHQCNFASYQYDPASQSNIGRSVLLDVTSPCFAFYLENLLFGTNTHARSVLEENVTEYCRGVGRDSPECSCLTFDLDHETYCSANQCDGDAVVPNLLPSDADIAPLRPCSVDQLFFRNGCAGATGGTDGQGVPCSDDGSDTSFVQFSNCNQRAGHTIHNHDHDHHTIHSSAEAHQSGEGESSDASETQSSFYSSATSSYDGPGGCHSVCNPHYCWYGPCMGSYLDSLWLPSAYDFVRNNQCGAVCFQVIGKNDISVGSAPLPHTAWQVGNNIVQCQGALDSPPLLSFSPIAGNNGTYIANGDNQAPAVAELRAKPWKVVWSKGNRSIALGSLVNTGGVIANWTADISFVPRSTPPSSQFPSVVTSNVKFASTNTLPSMTLTSTMGTIPGHTSEALNIVADISDVDATPDNTLLEFSIRVSYDTTPTASSSQLLTLDIPVLVSILPKHPTRIETVRKTSKQTWTNVIIAFSVAGLGAIVTGVILYFLLRKPSPSKPKPPRKSKRAKQGPTPDASTKAAAKPTTAAPKLFPPPTS